MEGALPGARGKGGAAAREVLRPETGRAGLRREGGERQAGKLLRHTGPETAPHGKRTGQRRGPVHRGQAYVTPVLTRYGPVAVRPGLFGPSLWFGTGSYSPTRSPPSAPHHASPPRQSPFTGSDQLEERTGLLVRPLLLRTFAPAKGASYLAGSLHEPDRSASCKDPEVIWRQRERAAPECCHPGQVPRKDHLFSLQQPCQGSRTQLPHRPIITIPSRQILEATRA